MKKTVFMILLLIVMMGLSNNTKRQEEKEEVRGVFISYIEIMKYLKNKEEQESKNNIQVMIENIKNMNLNTIILQVRPSSDAIYKSKIFPLSKYLTDNNIYSYDVLQYFIEESHHNNLKLFAWVNPYRVQTTDNVDLITKDNPAYQYIGTDTIYINNGIYYNPSKKEVTNLIVEGIKEITNYKVDGILFDDYFYPNKEIDQKDYEEYKKTNPISEDEYRLMIINNMVQKVHEICKKKNIPFGISPEGNIENNYTKNFADIRQWLSSTEYVDFIMPQLYYGFENSMKPFIETSKEWEELIINPSIKLIPALAFYKIGKLDQYAKEGKDEWINHNDIIMKEIIVSRSLKNYEGFTLFRYDNIFNPSEFTKNSQEEINNVKKIVK